MAFRFQTPRVCMALGIVALLGMACNNEPSSSNTPDAGGGEGNVSSFAVGGTVSGLLEGTSVVLENVGEQVTVNANKAFTFEKKISTGATYAVTIAKQPNGQECSLDKRTAIMGTADVSDVKVTCTPSTFTIGGFITGLEVGDSVLVKNGSDSVTVTSRSPP